MNIFYPVIRWKLLPSMLGIAALGGLAGGLYGILHDQITYSISPEYFTHLKFHQFDYANFGLPPRGFAAEIGFLATWWVGFFAAWFLARIAAPAWPARLALRRAVTGFLLIFIAALAAAAIGLGLGIFHGPDYGNWEELGASLGIRDLPAFVTVAYIHNASYLGGLLGLIGAIVHLRRLAGKATPPRGQPDIDRSSPTS